MRRPGLLEIAFGTLLAAGCREPAPAAPARESGDNNPDVAALAAMDPAAAVDAAAVTAIANADPPAQPAARAPTVAFERVAGLDTNRMVAIAAGEVYRLVGDHWQRARLSGAVARDVVSARGSMWILAKGTGPNLGRALVIRTRTGDDLQAVASPMLGPGNEPRALAVVRESEFYIAGENPAMARVGGGDIVPISVGAPRVDSLRRLHDDTLIAIHGTTRVTISRWGEGSTIDLDDYLDEVMDSEGAGYLVHAHGQISRGRPGREYMAVTTASPFVPRAAAVIGGGRLALVGPGGPFAVWHSRDWVATEGPFPPDPIAILSLDRPVVVGRGGEVVVVENPAPRTLVSAGRIER